MWLLFQRNMCAVLLAEHVTSLNNKYLIRNIYILYLFCSRSLRTYVRDHVVIGMCLFFVVCLVCVFVLTSSQLFLELVVNGCGWLSFKPVIELPQNVLFIALNFCVCFFTGIPAVAVCYIALVLVRLWTILTFI